MPPKLQKAKSSAEIINEIMSTASVSQYLDQFTMQVDDEGKKKILPFSLRKTLPLRNILKIFFAGHVIWKKGDKEDSFSDGTFPALLAYVAGVRNFNVIPNTLEDMQKLDSCIKQFLLDGYLVISPKLLRGASSLAKQIREQGASVDKKNAASNVLEHLPLLCQAFDDPIVKTVIARLLGDDFVYHPHSHIHKSKKGRKDQHWHRDDFQDYERPPAPKLELHNIMAMYYPQDTILEMGPTAVRRCTQYSIFANSYIPDRFLFTPDAKYLDLSLTVPEGAIVLMHWDLVHRRSANVLATRYMFKVSFCRTVQPDKATLVSTKRWEDIDCIDITFEPAVEIMAKKVWNWINCINGE